MVVACSLDIDYLWHERGELAGEEFRVLQEVLHRFWLESLLHLFLAYHEGVCESVVDIRALFGLFIWPNIVPQPNNVNNAKGPYFISHAHGLLQRRADRLNVQP